MANSATSATGHIGVLNPHDNDILCGRGGTYNTHYGNQILRVIACKNKELYQSSQKHHKILVSRAVFEALKKQNPPARFLAKSKNKDGLWYEVDDKRAVEKISQTLRDQARLGEGGIGSSNKEVEERTDHIDKKRKGVDDQEKSVNTICSPHWQHHGQGGIVRGSEQSGREGPSTISPTPPPQLHENIKVQQKHQHPRKRARVSFFKTEETSPVPGLPSCDGILSFNAVKPATSELTAPPQHANGNENVDQTALKCEETPILVSSANPPSDDTATRPAFPLPSLRRLSTPSFLSGRAFLPTELDSNAELKLLTEYDQEHSGRQVDRRDGEMSNLPETEILPMPSLSSRISETLEQIAGQPASLLGRMTASVSFLSASFNALLDGWISSDSSSGEITVGNAGKQLSGGRSSSPATRKNTTAISEDRQDKETMSRQEHRLSLLDDLEEDPKLTWLRSDPSKI